MIHREGYTIIAGTLVIAGILGWVVQYYLGQYKIWSGISYVLILAFVVLIVQFFRNPSRTTIINPKHVIAPADGKMVIIEDVEEPEYFKGKRLQLSIFMSPVNVHVNRNPVTGQVKYFKYHPGDYLVAWHPKSSTLNERTTVVVENEAGIPVLYRQIAGALARRIRWYIGEGDQVKQGEEYGFIKFGSRIDIYLPPGTQVNVNIGEKVRGGETVLATFE
ncbi:MAG: phosphatidylserine decarboxylase family protein [Sphingobacteriaceae bacterium]|nr:phosphatidylserine decarboxylase family protein [Sphingobacteriaceae bacterium]